MLREGNHLQLALYPELTWVNTGVPMGQAQARCTACRAGELKTGASHAFQERFAQR